MRVRLQSLINVMLMLCLALQAGCSRGYFRRSADKEVYKAISERARGVPGMSSDYSIDRELEEALADAPVHTEDAPYLGAAGEKERGAHLLTLERALSLAVTHSRSYQNARENLYLVALDYTLARHQFAPIFSGTISGFYERSTSDITKLPDSARLAQAIPGWIDHAGSVADFPYTVASVGGSTIGSMPSSLVSPAFASAVQGLAAASGSPGLTALGTFLNPNNLPANPVVTGASGILNTFGNQSLTQGDVIRAYSDVAETAFTATGVNQPRDEIMDERDVSARTQLAVGMLMKGGTEVGVSLTSNFLRYLTGDPRINTTTVLEGAITRPLLQGGGKLVTMEPLVQSQRNLLYEIRDFTRFRKEFAVDVASNYYRVLQARDTARNTYLGYQAFEKAYEREKARAEVGRITQADLGRSEQAKLQAEVSWVSAVSSYEDRMDAFKILLGLPTDAPIVLDRDELDALMVRGLKPSIVGPEDAIQIGLAARLDLLTARDSVEDAERQVKVAARNLLPGLDLVISGSVTSDRPGESPQDRFTDLDWERARWSAGFDTDLPFDRKQERNTYRRQLIRAERAMRDYELSRDNVKLEIRQTWRDLERAERTYAIQRISVNLNERRVEEQQLRAEYGRATALDQIDAQNDLIDSQNSLTAALVDHTVAYLEFWLSMGILYIKEDGRWEDITGV